VKSAVLAVLAAVLLGCSTGPSTKVDITWAAPQVPPAKSFKRLLIITVAREEFVQIAFQDQMAAKLKALGINAVASKRYFTRYTDAERARYKQAVDSSGADYVLLARLTGAEETTYEDRGLIVGPSGVPYADAGGVQGAFARYAYPSSYVAGGDFSTTTITAETSIYGTPGEKLIWAVRTRTANANRTTGTDYAPEYVEVILDAMKKDKLL
jgi:hypothetical protein